MATHRERLERLRDTLAFAYDQGNTLSITEYAALCSSVALERLVEQGDEAVAERKKMMEPTIPRTEAVGRALRRARRS